MRANLFTRHQHTLFPSAAFPAVPTCTFPPALFRRESLPEPPPSPATPTPWQRWQDRGAGFVVGLGLAGLLWWGWG
jgi:hypothetical protein